MAMAGSLHDALLKIVSACRLRICRKGNTPYMLSYCNFSHIRTRITIHTTGNVALADVLVIPSD